MVRGNHFSMGSQAEKQLDELVSKGRSTLQNGVESLIASLLPCALVHSVCRAGAGPGQVLCRLCFLPLPTGCLVFLSLLKPHTAAR
jgi:hypothetical protein